MEKLREIQVSERIKTLDVIRGFAILGIFLVNIIDFSSPFFRYDVPNAWDSGANGFVYQFVHFIPEASFYTLFSFLFGFGAAIFYERALQKGVSFPYYFSRRLLTLLAFGALHFLLIWAGDILFTYAVLGFLLMPMVKWSVKTLLILAMVLFSFDVIMVALIFVGTLFDERGITLPENIENVVKMKEALATYGSGTWLNIFQFRLEEWLQMNGTIGGWFSALVTIFPMFLVGVAFCKARWIQEAARHRLGFTSLFVVTAILGLGIKATAFLDDAYPHYELFFQTLRQLIGGPLLAMAFMSGLTLLMLRATWQPLLAPLSYVGRMSMTNYLLQSVISTSIFYSYGLGLYGKVPPTLAMVYVALLYTLQVVFSRLWLTHYKQGPVERVWRFFTYGK